MDAADITKFVAEKETLLKDLLTAVKDCQKKYGGHVELATELDVLVAHLCHCFEVIFSHGLKIKEPKKLIAVKVNENTTFWDFVLNFLSVHEQDRFNNLKKVKSNIGKGRAWIRSSLNERTFERYLSSIICNENLLSNYYESYSFLRDQEKSYILPTTAAGLVPILFAISIDRVDMNQKNCDINESFNNEPIIQTSPMDVLKVNDVRNKIRNNIIDFEDGDDSFENSGNYDEVNASSPARRSMSELSQIVEVAEDASETMIFDDSSSHGSEEKLSSGLRPVGDQVIDELIPVLSETSELDHSALFPDCPSEDGISLDSCEENNFQKLYESTKEEFKKQVTSNVRLEAKIEELNRENEVLKHQLRKYVSAVQMLKRNDADHTYEAQLYENKLVQVAEMHGELMELNRRLQISLLAKEHKVKLLEEELVSLRGPLPSEEFSLHQLVSLWVPSVFLSGKYVAPHHVYQVHFRIGSEEWNIYRRYSQFHSFHQKLRKEYAAASVFQFPPKKTIGNKDSTFVEERRKKLQMYLRQVINFLVTQERNLTPMPTKTLLVSKMPFFGEQYKEISKRQSNIFKDCLSSNNQIQQEDTSSLQYTGL